MTKSGYKEDVLKIDHVGIIVRDLEKAVNLYKELLNVPMVFEENLGWISAIVQTESGKLELMQQRMKTVRLEKRSRSVERVFIISLSRWMMSKLI